MPEIMPGNGGLLDPVLQQYMQQQRQQQFQGMLMRMGQALMSANRQGQSPLRALAAGMAQGQGQGGTNPMQMLQMQDYLDKRRGQQKEQQASDTQAGKYAEMVGGQDPRSGIAWDTGRMGPGQPGEGLLGLAKQRGMNPAMLQGMLAGMGPEAGSKALLGMTKPAERKTATDVAGYRRDLGTGERVFPGVEKPAPEPTERQRKIRELKARGLSQSQAEDIASGRVRVSTDPVTGAVRLVNVATGRMTQPQGQSGIPKKTRAEMASQVQSIDSLLVKMPSLQEAIEKGVGFIPAAKEFGGKVLGQLPTGSVDIPGIGEIGTGEKAVHPEVVKARTSLRIFREDAVAAFRKSGKVPVQEQTRILEFIDKLGVLNSVPDAKLAFQQLETELRRLRDNYGIKLGGQAPSSAGQRSRVQTDDDYNSLPSGAEFSAPDGTIRRKP